MSKAIAPALILLGLTLGLWGIRWGLPGRQRLERVVPPGLDGPAFQKELADAWAAMDRRMGQNRDLSAEASRGLTGIVEIPGGWKTPPAELLNSYRSFYDRTEQEDEQSILLALATMKPRRLQFNTHHFIYGSFYVYSVGAVLALGAATGLVTLKNSLLYYLGDPSKMAAMYLAGRLLSVASFVACGLMLLRLGRRYVGLEAGALAAAIFLMTPAAVTQATLLKIHMFWTFFALWTVERCGRVLERGALKDYAAAGAVAGLTVATSVGAWPACIIVAAAGAMRLTGLHEPNGTPRKPLPEIQGLVLSGLCAIAAFLITNPYWVLAFREGMVEMRVDAGQVSTFNLIHPVLFIENALRHSVTDPVLTLMLGGTVLALFKGRRQPVLLLCGVTFLIALAAMATDANVISTYQVRHFLGWVGVASLLAGYLLQELRALKGTAGRCGGIVAVIVLAGLACQGFSYAYNYHLGENDRSTHFIAGEWIDQNIPAGETIGLLRFPQPSNSPFFHFDRYRLKLIEPKLAAALPPEQLPRWLALTAPDYFEDRPALSGPLSRYELRAAFSSARLFPWITLDPALTPANPIIEIYRLKS
ncbi:MAG: hypothetical protein ACHQ2Z_04105 [Elusimicrobiota bacterium]